MGAHDLWNFIGGLIPLCNLVLLTWVAVGMARRGNGHTPKKKEQP